MREQKINAVIVIPAQITAPYTNNVLCVSRYIVFYVIKKNIKSIRKLTYTHRIISAFNICIFVPQKNIRLEQFCFLAILTNITFCTICIFFIKNFSLIFGLFIFEMRTVTSLSFFFMYSVFLSVNVKIIIFRYILLVENYWGKTKRGVLTFQIPFWLF